MKQMPHLLLAGIFTFSSAFAVAATSEKLKSRSGSDTPTLKKKVKDYCSAIGNSVRNIRSIKELTRELDKYSNDVLFDCIKKLSRDPSLRTKLARLKHYLESRKSSTTRTRR